MKEGDRRERLEKKSKDYNESWRREGMKAGGSRFRDI